MPGMLTIIGGPNVIKLPLNNILYELYTDMNLELLFEIIWQSNS